MTVSLVSVIDWVLYLKAKKALHFGARTNIWSLM